MGFFFLPHTENLNWAFRSWDGQLDLIVSHRNFGSYTTLMVDVGVQLQARVNIVWEVRTNFSHKFNTSRWHKSDLSLWITRKG